MLRQGSQVAIAWQGSQVAIAWQGIGKMLQIETKTIYGMLLKSNTIYRYTIYGMLLKSNTIYRYTIYGIAKMIHHKVRESCKIALKRVSYLFHIKYPATYQLPILKIFI